MAIVKDLKRLSIPTEPVKSVKEGEMIEIPDESGHGASGFSIDAKAARGFSKFDNDNYNLN